MNRDCHREIRIYLISHAVFGAMLNPSVLGRVFIFILLIICQFYTASEIHVGIKIGQTLGINLLTSIDPS